MSFYVYELIDPTTGRPIMVGIGSDPVNLPPIPDDVMPIDADREIAYRFVGHDLTYDDAVILQRSVESLYGLAQDSSQQKPQYATVQINRDIHRHIKNYCAQSGLHIGRFVEILFQNHITGSIIQP